MKKIVLASGSPRRKELLAQIGFEFEVIKSDVEEVVDKSLKAYEVPVSLSKQKAMDVLSKCNNDTIVIGADTVVVFDGQILGKPKDETDVFEMLKKLSGNTHSVYTGVCIAYYEGEEAKTDEFYSETKVKFDTVSDDEIREYIATKDPLDKAGAYGIQGMFARHIEGIEGDYFNVVGLPVTKVYKSIKKILKNA